MSVNAEAADNHDRDPSDPGRDTTFELMTLDGNPLSALERLRRSGDEKWTVADLAPKVAVYRSLLDGRFRRLGRSPIRYLTERRMHLAKDLLGTTDLGVATIAHRVGYDSEEAFSRAFKRALGAAPTTWRGRAPH